MFSLWAANHAVLQVRLKIWGQWGQHPGYVLGRALGQGSGNIGSGFNSAEACWLALGNMLNLSLFLFHHLKMRCLQLWLAVLKVKYHDARADQQGRCQLWIKHIWGKCPRFSSLLHCVLAPWLWSTHWAGSLDVLILKRDYCYASWVDFEDLILKAHVF